MSKTQPNPLKHLWVRIPAEAVILFTFFFILLLDMHQSKVTTIVIADYAIVHFAPRAFDCSLSHRSRISAMPLDEKKVSV